LNSLHRLADDLLKLYRAEGEGTFLDSRAPRKDCPFCDNVFTAAGYGQHRRFCEARQKFRDNRLKAS
jgi:hypothetical protein